MKRGQKKKQPKVWQKGEAQDADGSKSVPMSKWGKDKSIYYESGDSGTESDEEHLVEEAIDEEKRHLSRLHEESFQIFGSIKKLPTPQGMKDLGEAVEQINIDELDKQMAQQQDIVFFKSVSQVLKDINISINGLNAILQMKNTEEEEEGEIDEATEIQKKIIYSLIMNGCHYLYLVSRGYRSPHHAALDHIKELKVMLRNMLEGKAPIEEEEDEYEYEYDAEQDDRDANGKHIPVHLRTIKEGQYRAVSESIAKNQIYQPNKPQWRKNARVRHHKDYRRAMHKYKQTHKQKEAPRDGVYKGELGGIDKNKIGSVQMRPAH